MVRAVEGRAGALALLSFTASRLFRRSLICPWNCGSNTFADSTNDTRANTSSERAPGNAHGVFNTIVSARPS